MDVSRATLTNLGSEVALEDPQFPWRVIAAIREGADRPEISRLTVETRDGSPVTASVLAEIPVRQIAGVAASTLRGEGEAHYRMLAKPRAHYTDGRTWPAEHYERVARVAAWARSIGREGGEAGAVSEFWNVHHRTARRWLAHLRSVSARR